MVISSDTNFDESLFALSMDQSSEQVDDAVLDFELIRTSVDDVEKMSTYRLASARIARPIACHTLLVLEAGWKQLVR